MYGIIIWDLIPGKIFRNNFFPKSKKGIGFWTFLECPDFVFPEKF